MTELTDTRRDELASEIYNISRRLRQITNGITDIEVKEKLIVHIVNLNIIGAEIGGGIDMVMSKVLRTS